MPDITPWMSVSDEDIQKALELARRQEVMRMGGGHTPEEINAAYEEGMRNNLAIQGQNAGQEAGNVFGDRMRKAAMSAPSMIHAQTDEIDRSRVLGDQSYAQQQQALSMMRAQAMGQGPSVAELQGTAGLDDAGRQMMGPRGAPMTGAMMSSTPQDIAAKASMGRAQETNQALGAWGQGANAMRGQSLQGQQQAMSGGWRATDLSLGQQQQNLERELALQKLAQGGYQAYTGAANDRRNVYAGVMQSAAEAQRNATAGYLNMLGSGVGQGLSMIPTGGGKKDTNPAHDEDWHGYWDSRGG